MGLARGVERRLEQLVDGLASRLFRGRVHPVELGTRIVREADLAVFDTPAGTGAPNSFHIVLGGEREPDEAVEAAQVELAAVMAEAAAERGWRLEGPATVRIDFGAGPASSISIEAAVEPGEIEPWAYLDSPVDSVPVRSNRSIIGRSASADIHLGDEEVSRRHALLWREGGSAWLADLGSGNGTYLNGERCTEAIDVFDGDRVGFAGLHFGFRVI